MPAKSKAQQKAAGAAFVGRARPTRPRASSGAPRSRWPKSMTEKQLEDFASTRRKGKPEHVG